jgi:hypothetical protein
MEITPIILAALAAFVVGALWYSPIFFLKPWLRATGKTAPKGTGPLKAMGVMFLIQLIVAYVLSMVIAAMGAFSATTGMQTAAWLWLGFILCVAVSNELFEKRSWKLILINTGYQLVAMLAMGAILGTW